MHKLIAIVGPTASGKSALAIALAKKYDGEVVSADSRQIYRGFDATTAKVTPAEMDGVPHHLINIAGINEPFSVADFKKHAEAAVEDIVSRGKLPIVAGGTGHYIDALLYNQTFPEVPPNEKLREALEKRDAENLYAELVARDPARAAAIDPYNKKRLVRALEIIETMGKVPPLSSNACRYDATIIGLAWSDSELRARIEMRTTETLETMIEEARAALNLVTDARAQELGFDFELPRSYLRNKLTKEELWQKLVSARWQYSRRQMRWFKRNGDIHWVDPVNAYKKELF